MAYPGAPSGPTVKGTATFAGGSLTADDLDQLASAFRPSWEFDEAPFVGAGTMSPNDLRALQGGGGIHADVRAAAQSAPVPLTNGTHAPAKPAAVSNEPETSVIIDRRITAAEMAPAPQQSRPPVAPAVVAPAVVVAAPFVAPPVMTPAPPPMADRLAQTRIVSRRAPVPAARESTGSFDARALRGSKRPLWIGLGVGAVALVAVGVWAASGSSSEATPAPAPVIVKKSVETAAPDIPPPPPETTPAAVVPPPKTVPISALAQVPAPAAPPSPAPAPRPVAAPVAPSPAPAPRPAAVPTPKPAAKPKGGGGTIVHDVPF